MDKIRILPVLEVKGDVFKESGLVVFDGEVVMSVSLVDQVVGDFALGQKGIGGNFFALNIDGIKQGDGDLDLVGAFEFFSAFYRDGGDFFWV